MNNRQILEALKMQPLSEEEKSARHILGRLYGPIATCNEGTRNGRTYNRELWERALADDLFKEKINNKSLFLELGHPVNREETDMEKVCACIPEMPKIVDGDLYAYVDILDTNNGKLLKTLCDYGFVPGISSRGSGDVMPNNEVDPETFFLETWDIVQLPAVKNARLQMCEGLDAKALKLKKVLTESYAQASDSDKKMIKEALDNLDIQLDEESEENIPWASEDNELVEETDKEEIIEDNEQAEDVEELKDDEDAEITAPAYTVGDLQKELDDYDKDLNVEFMPLEIEGKEYQINMLGFDDSEEGKVVISIGYDSEESDNIDEVDDKEVDEVTDEVADASDEEIAEKAEDDSEEAIDDGDEEVIESLKEMIRQKDLLESELKSLKNERTVSDTEVNALKEELEKYKVAFARTSEVAAKAKKFETKINQLTEQLNQKDVEIKNIKQEHSANLVESVDNSKQQIKSLQEKLIATKTELDETETKLTEQVNIYKKKLNDRTKIAIAYKEKCTEAVNKYIAFRASMLGVKPAEIVNKLDENYSMDDVEKVCDSILTENVNISKLPYGFDKGSRVKINESKTPKSVSRNGYDIDDSLLELAGLK